MTAKLDPKLEHADAEFDSRLEQKMLPTCCTQNSEVERLGSWKGRGGYRGHKFLFLWLLNRQRSFVSAPICAAACGHSAEMSREDLFLRGVPLSWTADAGTGSVGRALAFGESLRRATWRQRKSEPGRGSRLRRAGNMRLWVMLL